MDMDTTSKYHVTRGKPVVHAATGMKIEINIVNGWVVRIQLLEGRETPLKNTEYLLIYGTQRYEGTTDGDGIIEQYVEFEFSDAAILIHDLMIPIEIEVLASCDTVEGVQARLNNLGFECGFIDGESGDNTSAALKAFKRTYKLSPINTEIDGQTQQKLFTVHGC